MAYFAVFLVLCGLLLRGALDRFVAAEFEQIEIDDARMTLIRAMETIRNDGQSLRTWARDIGPWTATYGFAETRDIAYIVENFPEEYIAALEFDLLMFVDNADAVFWSYIDEQQSIEDFRPADLRDLAGGEAGWNSSAAGLHPVGDSSVYLIAAHPILKSDESGPSRGVVILGRRLDNARFERLIQSTVANFDLQTVRSDSRLAELAADLSSESAGIKVVREDGDSSAYAVLNDVYDMPAMILKVRTHKHITTSGSSALRATMTAYLAMAILAFALAWILMARWTRNETAT